MTKIGMNLVEEYRKNYIRDPKAFALKLEKRTAMFAVLIIKLSAKLPNTSEARVIKNQVTKSGTSVGANYREANRARSKADFWNKIKICESESSKTVYWLTKIDMMKWITGDGMTEEMKEAKELLALFTTIAKTTSQSMKK